jgi:hypothetical protein
MPDLSVRVSGLDKRPKTVALPLEELVNLTLGGLLNHVESKLGCKVERITADALRELLDTSPVEESIDKLFAFTSPLQVMLWGRVLGPYAAHVA